METVAEKFFLTYLKEKRVMQTHQKFSEDLDFGKIFEEELKEILEQECWVVIKSEGYIPEYDLYCFKDEEVVTYECKTDRETENTGNVAIEVGKVLKSGEYANGIYTTQAKYHAFKLIGYDYFYIIETERLKYLVENGFSKFQSKGGDGNRTMLHLIDVNVFIENCHRKIKRKEVPEKINKKNIAKQVLEKLRSNMY